ncbi:hypothetical protein KRR38_04755 [Novosphingobium sp. G106]|uniref:hypothetical protein n=1 Tax=Novosphingobium sp. G106 TaxID=2849500 RepID=UPI001C2CF8DC|nr:hypothetical protein [Novosphingobium sp. G106]MBV1687001.1 hypothetical protein [Novosphingobium sp. G106]
MTLQSLGGDRAVRERPVLRDLTALSPKPLHGDRAARPMRVLVSSTPEGTRAS